MVSRPEPIGPKLFILGEPVLKTAKQLLSEVKKMDAKKQDGNSTFICLYCCGGNSTPCTMLKRSVTQLHSKFKLNGDHRSQSPFQNGLPITERPTYILFAVLFKGLPLYHRPHLGWTEGWFEGEELGPSYIVCNARFKRVGAKACRCKSWCYKRLLV